jgi:glycosyltransferase involved in cell wall biosynthesis
MDQATKITADGPLVSIIMLTYNRANYIPLAIQSVIDQTYHNWELLIQDDGSTDETSIVVAGYSDSRIHYIPDPINKGLAQKRMESLKFTTGTYVAILDSDDIWSDTNKLTAQVAHLEANPLCAVVGTQITLIDAEGVQVGTNHYHQPDDEIRNIILVRNQFAHSSVLMRKSMLDQTKGYRDYAPSEDLDLFLQLGQFGTFANLPITGLAYRVHKKGESALKSKVVRVVLRAIRAHKHEYPNYFKAYIKFTLMLLVAKVRGK